MCVGIGAAIGIIGTIGSMAAGVAQANAQQQAAEADYYNKLQHIRDQEEQLQKTLNLQVTEQQKQYLSETRQDQAQLEDAAIKNMANDGRARAEIETRGVSGLSTNFLLASIEGEHNRFEKRITANNELKFMNNMSSLHAAQRQQTARLHEIPNPVPPKDYSGISSIGAIAGGLGKIGGIVMQA